MAIRADVGDRLDLADARARCDDAVPKPAVGVAALHSAARRAPRRAPRVAWSIGYGYLGGGSVQIQSRTRFIAA